MDQKQLEEKIKEAFLRLSPELQEIVGSGKWVDTIQLISKRNGLNIPQMGQVQTEVMLVLLGIIHPDKFLVDIKDSLNLTGEKIEKLIKETGDEIFLPIREKVMEIFVKNTAEDPAEVKAEKEIFDKAGISIDGSEETPTPSTAPIKLNESRADILKGIESPTKSQPTALNELSAVKSAIKEMKVPVAPYASTPQANVVKPSVGSGDIMANKLGGTFAVPKKDTDYSIKSLSSTPAPSTQPGKDAYREPIE